MNGKNIAKRCWKWSWLATLPATAVFLLWAFNTWNAYYAFMLSYKSPTPIGLLRTGELQAVYLLNRLKALVPEWRSRGEGLEEIHLYARESEIKKLNSALPQSGREYVKASLLYPDGKVHEVEIKYRGDFSNHWSGRKKSTRVKTKKSAFYQGMRQFNLIVPKTGDLLADYLSYALAKRMGLLVPEAKSVDVYVNGSYSGIYLMVEQLGEQFLRRNSRMPGDLFVGELVGRDQVETVGREVFLNPGFWTKDAINNHNPPEWNEPLKELTTAAYSGDPERLIRLLDIDSWARFAAFITICRTTHFDVSHNWRLYFDPARGKFEPVVWDPVGWYYKGFVPYIEKQSNRMDVITSFVFELLHSDQRFLAAKHAAVEEFFSTGGAEFLAGLMDSTERLEASASRDRDMLVNSVQLYSPSEALREMESFKQKTRESLEEVRSAYTGPPTGSYSVGRDGKIQVNVKGFPPIKYLEVEYGSPTGDLFSASVSFLKDGRVFSRDVTQQTALEGRTVRAEAPLFARRAMEFPSANTLVIIKDAVIKPASYVFDFKGVKGPVLAVRAGYAEGRVAALEHATEEAGQGLYPLDGNYGIIPVAEPEKTLAWSGDVVVDGVMEVDGGLEIASGTKVSFTPGSSLVVRGRLTAVGTAQRPVVFAPAKGGALPWGAVVLTGEKAGGSVLRHCVFSGGSGLRHGHVEYSAMLSIHGVEGVEIDNCLFSDNKIVDDMVHAVYSGVTVRESVFKGSRADALDLDYVEGRVINSRFIGSGNDALDLMSSRVAVLGSVMEDSGDKGISVGEGTDVFVWDTGISKNGIGVQAKDGSRAFLYNVELSENARTLDAYKKNWQYGDGGHVFVYKSSVRGDGLTADKSSSLSVYDSYIDTIPEKKKRIRIDGTSGAQKGFERRARTKESFLDSIELPVPLRPHLELVDPEVRGRLRP